MSRSQYVVVRLLLTIPMLLVLLTLIFLLLRVMPGDPVSAMLGGHGIRPQLLAEYRQRLGLNEPLGLQYLHYLLGIVRGDFGTSFRTGQPVLREIGSRFPATMELAIFGMLWAVLIGMGSGIWASVRNGRPADHAIRTFNIVAFAMPIFWVGLILQIVFGVWLKVLPIGGRLDPVSSAFFTPVTGFYVLDSLLRGDWSLVWASLRHLLLPSFTLGLVESGLVGRMTRTNMLEVLDRDYIRTARSKGLPERSVVLKHALRNALIPIVTVVGMQFALLLAGAILTETVFSWPGVARYLVVSIEARDFMAIQGTVVFIAVFISTVNLAVDLLYSRLDPRIRY